MKHLFSLLALLFAFNVEAQRKTYYASDFPELTHANGTKQVRDLYPTIERAKERYPSAYKWWTGVSGQSDATFLTMDLIPACWNEAVWAGNGSGYAAGVQCTSRNNVDFSAVNGQYMVNVACRVFQGRYIGAGTSIGLNGNASTELIYDAARWQDPAPIRAVILSANWGTETYLESMYLSDFRINGRAPQWLLFKDQHGIAVRMMGETAVIDRIYVSDCDGHGVWVNGAGPGKIITLSSFDNNLAGLYYSNDKSGAPTGSSLGMLQVGTLSCDNNWWQLKVDAGGAVVMDYLKSETGLSASRGKPNKQSTVIEASGWVNIRVRSITDAVVGPSGSAFVFNSLANKSTFEVSSYAQVAGSGSGRSALVADVRAQKVFKGGTPEQIKFDGAKIEWSGLGTSSNVKVNGTDIASEPFAGKGRMGIGTTYAAFNYAAGTPVADPTGGTVTPPVTPPCAYSYSGWGPCVGGKRTRTVVASTPTPCTGTPELEGPCTVTPPVGTKLTRANVTVAANTCEAVTAEGVTKAKIIVTLTALPTGYAKILSNGTTSLQTKDRTGNVYWGSTVLGTLKVGRNVLDITFPNPVNVTCLFQQKCPGGGALVGTYESIELY